MCWSRRNRRPEPSTRDGLSGCSGPLLPLPGTDWDLPASWWLLDDGRAGGARAGRREDEEEEEKEHSEDDEAGEAQLLVLLEGESGMRPARHTEEARA